MPKQSLASIAKGVRTAMKKHSPEILTGIGIAGMITTTVMAVKATPKALILLEEKKDELDTDRLEPKDIIKTAWPCYIPAVVVGSISVFCLIGASSTNLRRNAALATAYKPGCGGGILLRETENKKTGEKGYAAATGSKGFRWLESEMVKQLDKQGDIDRGYYNNMVDEAIKSLSV